MEVYHSLGMRRTSKWLIKNAFLCAFIGNIDRTKLSLAQLQKKDTEQFRPVHVFRAIDDAVARLGYDSSSVEVLLGIWTARS